MNTQNRLYRTRDSYVAGVCGGIARYFGLSAAAIRWLTLFLILFGGMSLWVYIVLWLLIPLEP